MYQLQATVILLLGLYTFAVPHDDSIDTHEDYSTAFETHPKASNVGVSAIPDERHKRAVSLLAWKSVLKNTIGETYQRVQGRFEKVFFKKGTYFQASKDFYSLGPQTVAYEGGVMIGKRGNQYIRLENSNGSPLQASLRISGEGKPRTLIYIDDSSDAGDALRQYQNEAFSFPRKSD